MYFADWTLSCYNRSPQNQPPPGPVAATILGPPGLLTALQLVPPGQLAPPQLVPLCHKWSPTGFIIDSIIDLREGIGLGTKCPTLPTYSFPFHCGLRGGLIITSMRTCYTTSDRDTLIEQSVNTLIEQSPYIYSCIVTFSLLRISCK